MLRGAFRRRLSSFAKTTAGSVDLKISASGLFSSDSTLLRARIFDTPTGQACWLPPFRHGHATHLGSLTLHGRVSPLRHVLNSLSLPTSRRRLLPPLPNRTLARTSRTFNAGPARQLPARVVAANASGRPPLQPATSARTREHASGGRWLLLIVKLYWAPFAPRRYGAEVYGPLRAPLPSYQL